MAHPGGDVRKCGHRREANGSLAVSLVAYFAPAEVNFAMLRADRAREADQRTVIGDVEQSLCKPAIVIRQSRKNAHASAFRDDRTCGSNLELGGADFSVRL